MPDIRTTAGRGRERALLEGAYGEGCPYAETEDTRCAYMEMQRTALDGLDIAEEMAEALKVAQNLTEKVAERDPFLFAIEGADTHVAARATLAKWDKWKGS